MAWHDMTWCTVTIYACMYYNNEANRLTTDTFFKQGYSSITFDTATSSLRIHSLRLRKVRDIKPSSAECVMLTLRLVLLGVSGNGLTPSCFCSYKFHGQQALTNQEWTLWIHTSMFRLAPNADFIALYTLILCPYLRKTCRKQSGPDWEPKAPITASPSISSSK